MDISAPHHNELHAPVTRPPGSRSRPVSPRTVETRAQTTSESEPLPGSIQTYCRDFINKVKAELSPYSQEWETIEHALREFQAGHLSKRQTHLTMSQAMGSRDELQQGLVGLLDHPEARWGIGDFDLSATIFHTPAPPTSHTPSEFLQHQHQPQMAMPVSSEWNSAQFSYQTQPTTPADSPTLFRLQEEIIPRKLPPQEADTRMFYENTSMRWNPGYNRHSFSEYAESTCQSGYTHNSMSNWNEFTQNASSSPFLIPPISNPHPFYQPYASPSINSGYPTNYNSAQYGTSAQQAYPYNPNAPWNNQAGLSWEAPTPRYQQEIFHTPGGRQHHSPPDSPMGVASYHDSPVKQPNFEMPPPSNHNSRVEAHGFSENASYSSTGQHRASEAPSYSVTDDLNGSDDGGASEFNGPSELDSKSSPVRTRKRKSGKKGEGVGRAIAGTGEFIHAICGKAFQSRSSVKKHHWGKKLDDKNSNSGCWAKFGKPNRAWDEHPSCHKPEVANKYDEKPRQNRRDSTHTSGEASEGEASVRIQNDNVVTLPDLDKLPDKVAEIVYATLSEGNDATNDYPRQVLSRDGPGMDSLLTAVNVVSQLDAPKPQEGRKKSLAAHLDAQVSANEQLQLQKQVNRMAMPWMNGTMLSQDLSDAAGRQHYYNTLESPFGTDWEPRNVFSSYQADQQRQPTVYPQGQRLAATQDHSVDIASRGSRAMSGFQNYSTLQSQNVDSYPHMPISPSGSIHEMSHTRLNTADTNGNENPARNTTNRTTRRARTSVKKKSEDGTDNDTSGPARKRIRKG